MRIKLLSPHGGLKAGDEWNCPWAAKARGLIEEGKALALEPCDLHLNPGAGDDDQAEGETEEPTAPGTEPPGAKKAKKPKPKKAKKPKSATPE